jgi:mannan endo-1,4-beta-mannosidase
MTMAGHHNREKDQGDSITMVSDIADGLYPALWSGDFLYQSYSIQNRQNVIDNLVKGWREGAVISLMYHACPPTQNEFCEWEGGVKSTLTASEWEDLITDGGSLNKVWKSRLDAIAPYFQQLKDGGIGVLFRPHHEMNQGDFWWGGQKRDTAALYRVTHDYLTNVKGLDNIVWVWSVQDLDFDFGAYNPGDAYWDVMSLDIYGDNGYTDEKYNAMLTIAGNKPIAIGECQVLPTASELASQPRWIFFMGWAELPMKFNSVDAIKAVYAASNVLTLNELSPWV